MHHWAQLRLDTHNRMEAAQEAAYARNKELGLTPAGAMNVTVLARAVTVLAARQEIKRWEMLDADEKPEVAAKISALLQMSDGQNTFAPANQRLIGHGSVEEMDTAISSGLMPNPRDVKAAQGLIQQSLLGLRDAKLDAKQIAQLDLPGVALDKKEIAYWMQDLEPVF